MEEADLSFLLFLAQGSDVTTMQKTLKLHCFTSCNEVRFVGQVVGKEGAEWFASHLFLLTLVPFFLFSKVNICRGRWILVEVVEET